jgi:hypothetical protein
MRIESYSEANEIQGYSTIHKSVYEEVLSVANRMGAHGTLMLVQVK